ncbi:hypothetical protein CLOSYM_00678 [[Clostridium] symbiosum ATCC 14940]|uniref:Uncharacterized protein n=1 Tax=[Clostridium] symbiosum ATCC 14940 TaxID=411472 RepID=A0ABC9U2B6_CLOSY|nr:hypothetical protein CLOSYM_00678 [[Clostridium] symbiosum ATCC 14940]
MTVFYNYFYFFADEIQCHSSQTVFHIHGRYLSEIKKAAK